MHVPGEHVMPVKFLNGGDGGLLDPSSSTPELTGFPHDAEEKEQVGGEVDLQIKLCPSEKRKKRKKAPQSRRPFVTRRRGEATWLLLLAEERRGEKRRLLSHAASPRINAHVSQTAVSRPNAATQGLSWNLSGSNGCV